MKRIPLTQGKFALVDDEDFEELNKHKWCYSIGYAQRRISKTRLLLMHRVILWAEKGQMVDHINMNGLDNRKNNLRLCTKAQNMMNRDKTRVNTSGYKGVSWDKYTGNWKAQFKMDGVSYNLGRFTSPKEAAIAYNNVVSELHGEFARLNVV